MQQRDTEGQTLESEAMDSLTYYAWAFGTQYPGLTWRWVSQFRFESPWIDRSVVWLAYQDRCHTYLEAVVLLLVIRYACTS